MRTNHWTAFITAVGIGLAAVAAEETATVKANKTNVRAQASLNSEVIMQLKKGESIVVLEEIKTAKPKKGEPAQWLRIALPSNTPLWIHAQYITNQVVQANKLNVRTGPGENYTVIARLDKGAVVKEIRRAGDWLEIEAPSGSSAYVAAENIERKSAATGTLLTGGEVPQPAPARAVPAPAPAPAPVIETVRVQPQAPVVTTPPKREVTVAPVEEPRPVVVVTSPPPAATPEEAPPATADASKAAAEEKKDNRSWWQRNFGYRKKSEAGASSASSSPVAEAKPAKAKPSPKPIFEADPALPELTTSQGPRREVTREGIVAKAWSIQAPSGYQLDDVTSGKRINFLYNTNTNLPMNVLKGRRVIVSGEEAIDKRWPETPLLIIETLKTVD